MKQAREHDLRIAAEAVRWQRALERSDAAERAEFADWIKASPRHLREFLFMEALDAAAKDLDPEHRIDVDAPFPGPGENVVPLRETAAGAAAARTSHRALLAAAAAAAIVALGLGWWARSDLFGGWQPYSTEVGEQRSVQLHDGSLLQLNTDSRVRVRLSESAREIQLLSGEALFKVAHDASRPFRVQSGAAVIRALGTEFNVYRRARDTQVAVVEGRVEILQEVHGAAIPPAEAEKPAQLGAGEAARIETDGAIVREAAVNVAEATLWRQRRLVFREQALGVIADEFNRYNERLRIVIEDEAVRARRFGGTFDADDPESLVAFALRNGDLQALRGEGRIVIRQRLEPPHEAALQ